MWYALTLALHFLVGPFIFLLVDTLQCGQRRWLAMAVALLFVFDTLQTPSNIEFPTGWDHRIFLICALLSLWAYVRFVRARRQQPGWYMLSFLAYMLAIMTYEQSFFFFLLHPLIALVEERRNGEYRLDTPDICGCMSAMPCPMPSSCSFMCTCCGYLFSGDSFRHELVAGASRAADRRGSWR